MLDPELLAQLRTVFIGLTGELQLALSPSRHPKQQELRQLLEEVASCSARVQVLETGPEVPVVRFDLLRSGEPTGITFRAVPGGHELSSLVLALLHAGGKGKLPDAGVVRRIRALRGPMKLRSYVSLECTNCPDVVQALDLMAILHGGLTHEVIDGELFLEEVTAAGIQAVPTVLAGDHVLQIGRSNLAELLERLEERFGTAPAQESAAANDEQAVREYEVVVVGGGPAGVTAAIYSARKGLKTAIVAGQIGGQVRETLGIENLISVARTEGPLLAAELEQQLRAHRIDVLEHRRLEAIVPGAKKELRLHGGERLRAEAVILALGARWRELGVPGEKEYLGRGVAFCPHCDGPFYAGRPVAVVGGGNSGVEAAIDLAGICSHVTLVEYQGALRADEVLVRKLRSLPNVAVVTGARVTEVAGDGKVAMSLRYQERASGEARELSLAGVFVQIGLVPNSSCVRELLELNPSGEIVVDGSCRTSVPGIYACGDVTTVPFKQIVIAMGEGAKAALTAFEDRMRAA